MGATARIATLLTCLLVAEQGFAQTPQPPRIEEFKLDLTADKIEAAQIARTRALASEAYLWGLPAFLHYRQATEIKQARRHLAPKEEPFGGWFLLKKLASADDRQNVMPNVDTLYGAAYLLLDRQGPIVLSLPAIKDRYYSVAFHDAYFNTFAVFGSRSLNGEASQVLILPPDFRGEIPAGFKRVIRAPTSSVALFLRIFTHGETDIVKASALQDRVRLRPLKNKGEKGNAFSPVPSPDFDTSEPVASIRDPLKYFEIVNAYTCMNKPSPRFDALVYAFKQVGLGPCAQLPSNQSLRAAIIAGAEDAQRLINARLSSWPMRQGWRVPDANTGRDSNDYLGRALVQLTQVGSFPADEAIYTSGVASSDGKPLDGKNTYRLTFKKGQFPPVDPGGFWSITMYDGDDNLLVKNAFNKSIIRPSTKNLHYNTDGSLTVYLSHQRPADMPEANWLPAPNGPFLIVLRTYLPQQAIQDQSWFPPPIDRMN